jgi:galactokinase
LSDDDFEATYGQPPEVADHAPGRVNLLGEHTDYNDGFVLPIALPQQTTVALGRAGGETFQLQSSAFPRLSFTLDQLPEAGFGRYVFGCLQEVLSLGHAVPALNIHVSSELPMGVGLSSSAALEVATLRALRRLLRLPIDDVELAKMAQHAEVTYAGVRCGIMDQMASSLSDTEHALFLDARTLETRLWSLPAGCSILVLDSGVPRALVSSEFNQRRSECEKAASLLGVTSLRDVHDHELIETLPEPWRRRARHVLTENARVLAAISGSDGERLGSLMNASHASLRDDYEVSVPALDLLVSLLQSHDGVSGAKLTGAGFGGACVAVVRAGQQERVVADVLGNYTRLGGRGRPLNPSNG